MARIWTAQYRYNGPDRLDITVKGKDPVGKFFAPTWDMVMKLKRGTMTERTYAALYQRLMRKSYDDNWLVWDNIISRLEVTFVCFCKDGAFCHRLLLAEYFKQLGCHCCGERRL
jgi:uncharacterized protein YeaO (DUF488 family)